MSRDQGILVDTYKAENRHRQAKHSWCVTIKYIYGPHCLREIPRHPVPSGEYIQNCDSYTPRGIVSLPTSEDKNDHRLRLQDAGNAETLGIARGNAFNTVGCDVPGGETVVVSKAWVSTFYGYQIRYCDYHILPVA